MIRELFAKYQFGAKHTPNNIPGKVPILVVCSVDFDFSVDFTHPTFTPRVGSFHFDLLFPLAFDSDRRIINGLSGQIATSNARTMSIRLNTILLV